MKLISAIVCSTAAIGGSLVYPGVAAAADVHCRSEHGTDVTVIDGETACRAATDSYGRAGATGIDGVGYANATLGATAIGVGAAGGVGASEGAGGMPVAVGFGPDAVALTSITDDPEARTFAISIALEGSRAGVETAEQAVVCLGVAAFAWNATTGGACLATPFGLWQTH
ncbi:DUF6764 family protein [Nocardia abscessus]|uniref:DUF6764 family protein n=1 Tax=Nocardia abscessus TaxID=120957 RepID=UPI00245637F0|nr:DUF6764 family protein [Nocardia abscessus]